MLEVQAAKQWVMLRSDVCCRAPKLKVSDEDSTKSRLLKAAEVSDTAADPISFKSGSTGNLKHSPQNLVRKEIV